MTTYYIDADDGDNGNTGLSEAQAWSTFAYAIANSASTDTIIVMDATANYTWSTEDIESRIIQGQSIPPAATFNASGASGVSWYMGDASQVKNIKFTNYYSHNSVDNCFEPNADNISTTFDNCVFDDIVIRKYFGVPPSGGIFCHYQSGNHSGTTWNITNCIVQNFRQLGVAGGGALLFAVTNEGATLNVTGCIFHFTSPAITQVFGDSSGAVSTVTVKNCIFYNDSGSSIKFAGTVGTYDNNCAYGTYSDIPSGTDDITDDPLFVDVANYDFNLRPTSPCIGTGVDL